MKKKLHKNRRHANGESGFSLLEVLISMAVMTIGLVGLLGTLGMAMAATQNSEQLAIAKRLANEAMEGILTARETTQVDWAQIANGSCNIGDTCGIFLAGAQPIYNPGADGIIGTNDDAAAGAQILDSPGPSGIIITPEGQPCAAPDVCTSLSNFKRTITIAPVTVSGVADGNLNSVVITVTYTNPQFRAPQNYVLATLISSYR
ncbi:MAG TPA: prepilin-type N-terminal cleavage/methylation domain-containing protein [Terriglobales bacterium]|nr:prepilin-type N-terminal cleavage/methylation domain-containing protein [Terriglobales bacterium]